jgi:ABC-type bacteriocin/lantibiotic exporter with double-glycine peptidase domain
MVGALIISALLEVVGIGLLVPLINILTNDKVSPSDSTFKPVLSLLGASTQLEMLITGLVFIGVVILVKNVVVASAMYFQTLQASKVRRSLEIRMFSQYLHADYKFHLNSNSAILSRNLVVEIGEVFHRALVPAFTLAVEGLTVIGILPLLLYFEPLPTTVLFIFFGSCYVAYTRLLTPLLHRLGLKRAELSGAGFKIISEMLGGIKEIKILHRESFYSKRFNLNRFESAKASARTETVERIPTYLVELWGVFGLLLAVFTLLLQKQSPATVISSLGLYLGASLRLIPALNRILIATQSLKVAKTAIEVVYYETMKYLPTQTRSEKIRFSKRLQFSNVSFSFDLALKPVIQNATFKIEAGESLGIVGPSGTGKSTLVDLLLGLLEPTDGEVLVDGQKLDFTKSHWKSQVGYVPQQLFLVDDTIQSNIAFGVENEEVSEHRLQSCIAAAHLSEFIESLPDGVNTLTGERGVRLSGGQRQRIGIARALYFEPSLLVLDEATSALDAQTESEIIRTLEGLHKHVTMVIISHRPSVLKFCDRVLHLENGQLSEQSRTISDQFA